MLRIGIVIYGSPDQTSGGYLYDRMLVRRLQASGHQVKFLSIPPGSYLSRPLSRAAAIIERQTGGDGPYDVLIIDELCHPSLALRTGAIRIAVDGSPKIVVLIHHLKRAERNPPAIRPLVSYFEKRLIDGADGLILNSSSTELEAAKLGGRGKPSVIAVPSGKRFDGRQEAEPMSSRGDAADGLNVLFVGNITPRKGLHTLIEAMASLDNDPARPVLVTAAGSTDTDPRYVRRVKQQATRIGCADRILFAGSVTDDALRRLYATHEVFCVPSQFEGFGIVYLEAMGFGMPAIGSAAGGAIDIIRDGRNGFLDPDDSAALADRLRRLRDEPELLRRMKGEALETYKTSPTWDESMGKIESYLTGLI